MNEIEKYRKTRLLFRIFGIIFTIAVFIYLIIVIINNSSFNVDCIVAVSIFGGYTLFMVLCFVIFDKRRLRLVEKHFGKVSAEDIEKSKELSSRINVIMSGEYSFLDDGRFECYDNMLKLCLKQISKGHKVYVELVNIYFEIQKEIEKSPEKDLDENRAFNAYVNELADLFDRNKSDI